MITTKNQDTQEKISKMSSYLSSIWEKTKSRRLKVNIRDVHVSPFLLQGGSFKLHRVLYV